MDNSMYPFQCCFLYVNEYYMEISMDQFGETLKVGLHLNFAEKLVFRFSLKSATLTI